MNGKSRDKDRGRDRDREKDKPSKGSGGAARAAAEAPARRSTTRVRLELDERRAQLLEFGKHFFASHAYDDVSMDEVAAAAGVSKGLLFHYFSSKREFYVETIRALSLQLRHVTVPDPSLPPASRLRGALDAQLKYARENGAMYVAFARSGIAIAPEVDKILEDHRGAVMGYLLENLGVSKAPLALRTALRAWMVMVQGVCLEAIADPELKEEDLRELLVAGYRALLKHTLESDPGSARLASSMVRRTRDRAVRLPGSRLRA